MKFEQVNFGVRIKNLRNKYGLSQLELEIEADLCGGTVSRLENNRTNPSKESLFKIISALGSDVDDALYLFGLDVVCQKDIQQSFNFSS